MRNEVTVNQRMKRRECHNPISGHRWSEDVPKQMWDVDGPLGHISSHLSSEAAEKIASEWRAFYKHHCA